MAAYAALLSLAQIADIHRNHGSYMFSISAKEKLRSIHEYVDFLLSVLEDSPEKANSWEGKIRDMAYEMEDIIDLFLWQKMQTSYTRMNPSNVELEDLLEDATERIGSMAGAMMEDRPTAISSSRPARAAISSSPSSSRAADAGNDAVIGLAEDLMAIKEWLCGHSSKLQVVPIVGMGGIDYTPHRLRYILRSLLESMKLLEERLSEEQIQESDIALRVYKNLKGRRYLVVMDDVWGMQVWDDLRNIFPDDNNGSRIILTSRLLDVAAYPNSSGRLHQMQFMTDSQSWDLLKQKVFTSKNCPLRLEKVGKEIARKCLGLPLVVLVAGFLSTVEKSVACWEEISRTVNTFVGEESDKILSLSYAHLPPHLRPCFLFIGGFPEDANIRASTLIKLWVAEGFMKHENRCIKSLEEEAEECLEDLVKRNLVIVTTRKSNGKIKRCSLHDIVRDMCIKKAHEEKFLHVRLQNTINEPRRLSLNGSHVDYIWGLNIRTILGFQLQNFPSWPAFLGRLRLLRVLDVVGDKYNELPSQVFELFHLTYLALTCPKKIPSAIANLVNLQTLIIGASFCRRSFEYASDFCLPVEIWSMPQLRHLVFYDLCMLPLPPYGSYLPLQNLQTLFYVYNLVWNLEMVLMIPNVKRLGLIYASNQEYNLHHLEHVLRLEKLQVNGFLNFSWRGQSPSFPQTLRKLTLAGGGFPWEDMSIIGSLPNIQVLKLKHHACSGETWETVDGEFPRLEFLLIDTSSIVNWVTQGSHLPRLKRLVILTCVFLEKIPEGIGDIPTLELIETNGTFLVESAMKIKEDQESYGNYALQVHLRQL